MIENGFSQANTCPTTAAIYTYAGLGGDILVSIQDWNLYKHLITLKLTLQSQLILLLQDNMLKRVEDCYDLIKIVTSFTCNDLFMCNDLYSFKGFAKFYHIASAIIANLSNLTTHSIIFDTKYNI